MKKKLLIFVDRDGTLIYDNKYYLGRQPDWKKKIKFLKGTIEGLRLLNKELPKAHIYLVSNQPGVAIRDFPLLTKKKANTVFKEIERRLKKKGIKIKGFFLCPHASKEYVKKHSEYSYDKKFAHKCNCFKPETGMIEQGLRKSKIKQKDTKIYVIGDRAADVRTALRVKGTGIIVPFKKEQGELTLYRKFKSKNKYKAKDFLQATKLIIKKEKQSLS